MLRQRSTFISSPLSICSRSRAQLITFSRRFITTVSTHSRLSMKSESEHGVEHEHHIRLYLASVTFNILISFVFILLLLLSTSSSHSSLSCFCYSQHPHLIRLYLASVTLNILISFVFILLLLLSTSSSHSALSCFCYFQHPHLIRLYLASCPFAVAHISSVYIIAVRRTVFLDLLLQRHWHFLSHNSPLHFFQFLHAAITLCLISVYMPPFSSTNDPIYFTSLC